MAFPIASWSLPIDLHIRISRSSKDTCRVEAISKSDALRGAIDLPQTTIDAIKGEIDRLVTGERFQETDMRALGTHFFKAIFREGNRDVLRRLQERLNPGQYLRLLLEVQDPGLRNYPWELLFDPWMGRYLGEWGKTTFVRYLPDQWAPEPLATGVETLKILVVIPQPEPSKYPSINAQLEKALIEEALKEDRDVGKVQLEYTTGSLSAIKYGLEKFDPDVLHFVGHGDLVKDTPYLLLEGPNHEDLLANPTLLENQLFPGSTVAQSHLRLVLLTACRTSDSPQMGGFESMAHVLARRVGTVVAMQYPIRDSSAKIFTYTLYKYFSRQFSLDRALIEARRLIRRGDPTHQLDWLSPVLVTCSSVLGLSRTENPFQGAYNYQLSDENKFHGREQEKDELRKLVEQNPIVVVNGPPASGKTSLLMAGFMPVASRTRHPIHVVTSENLENQLRSKINDALKSGNQQLPAGKLDQIAQEIPGNLVLILDQVEQVRYLGFPATELITALIQGAIEQDRKGYGYKLIISARPDLDRKLPAIVRDHVPNLPLVTLTLDMLDRDKMRAAILESTQFTRYHLTEDAVTHILARLDYENKPNMMAVQVVCQALFNLAVKHEREIIDTDFITQPALGDVDGIMDRYFNVAQKLKNAIYRTDKITKILAHFVRSDGEGACSLSYKAMRVLWQEAGETDLSTLDRQLNQLVEDNILRIDRTGTQLLFWLVHESFIHQIRVPEEKTDGQIKMLRRCWDILYNVGEGLVPIGDKNSGLTCLASARDQHYLPLIPEHKILVFRSALVWDLEHEQWADFFDDDRMILAALDGYEFTEEAYLRAIPYLERILERNPTLRPEALDLAFIWIESRGVDVRQAASSAVAKWVSPDDLKARLREKTIDLASIARMYDQENIDLSPFEPSQRKRIRWTAVQNAWGEVVFKGITGGLLGAMGFALVALYNWYRVAIFTRQIRYENTTLEWLSLLPLGLMILFLAFPGMGLSRLGSEYIKIHAGRRRKWPSAWGAILSFALGTGFNFFVITLFSWLKGKGSFDWAFTLQGLIVGALAAGGRIPGLFFPKLHRATALFSTALGALGYYLFFKPLDEYLQNNIVLTASKEFDAWILGAILGFFIWLALAGSEYLYPRMIKWVQKRIQGEKE